MKTTIVDYGMGNLHSVLKSVETAAKMANLSAQIVLSNRAEDILTAERVIFPGQGAMPDCMVALNKSGLGAALKEALNNKPFFGICVGAQLLFEHSEEGNTSGLGHFSGSVKRFAEPLLDSKAERLKVPHMGWNTVYQTQAHPLFQHIAQNERFYFVHSYYFAPQDKNIVLAKSEYPDDFACVVGKDNVFATQFHTEKSHCAGLQMLQNFLSWRP